MGSQATGIAKRLVVLAGLALPLGACGGSLSDFSVGSLNPFKQVETKLPGERVAVLAPKSELKLEAAQGVRPPSLPSAVTNASWSAPGGNAANAPGHLSLEGGLNRAWTQDAGEGSSSRGRLTATPIVVDGKIITLDTHGNLSAFNVGSGARVWRTSLTPQNEKDHEGFGGGIAADSGAILAVTGYGTAVSVNPANGQVIWTQKIGVPIRQSPVAANGKLIFTTTEGRVFCLSIADGSEVWSGRGLADQTNILTNASPAIDGSLVAVPFSSGEIQALDLNTGQLRWTESLSRAGAAASNMAAMSDAARPALSGGVLYAVGHAGRMIATNISSGERIWSQTIAGTKQPWPAGDAVYVVDTKGQMAALAKDDGKPLWVADLPGEAKRWSGPVLAGGRLWAVSAAGLLVGVDATTGQVSSKVDLDEAVFIAPVVANGRLFVFTDRAKLVAFN